MGFDETTLARIEKQHARGLTSAEILGLFERHGLALSEATLRKYIQLGLLPRSVRVGRKGKHQGSQGVYPVEVIREILRIKRMMAESYTIEQIQREFLFMRTDLHQLEQTLDKLFKKLESVLKERKSDRAAVSVARDVKGARSLSKELLSRLGQIEQRLTSPTRIQSVIAS